MTTRMGRRRIESSTKKTPKFMKKAGKKREYYTYEGVYLFNKVRNEWKRLASENKEQTWE
jgi:hypothetical protein